MARHRDREAHTLLAACGAKLAKLLPEMPSEQQCERDGSFIELPDWAQKRALARATLLAHLRDFVGDREISRAAIEAFAREWNSGAIAGDAETCGEISRVSAPTIVRWLARQNRGGLIALAPKGGGCGGGAVESDPRFCELALAMVAHFKGHLRAIRIHEAALLRFPGEQVPSPSSIRRFLRRWKRENASLELANRNPDRWKSRYRSKIADASEGIVRYLQELQIDGTPADIRLVDGRFHLLKIIDVFSRRRMSLVAPSESGPAAVQLVARAITAWGLPEILHGDNGKGFLSNHAQRVFEDLGIRYVASPPFRPETKPFVESAIGGDRAFFEEQPGFAGHSVAEAQDIRSQKSFAARFGAPPQKIYSVKLSATELQERIDLWDRLRNASPHSGLDGRTPEEVAASWTGEVRRISDGAALALLAEAAEPRVILADGIHFAGARFLDRNAEFAAHIGPRVLVFPDPSGDLGKLFVFCSTAAIANFFVLPNVLSGWVRTAPLRRLSRARRRTASCASAARACARW